MLGDTSANSTLAHFFDTPINPADGILPQAPPGPENAPVPGSGHFIDQPAEATVQDQLQARLTQLDQAIAQCQQDLQGALAAHAQYTADRHRITADIQAGPA